MDQGTAIGSSLADHLLPPPVHRTPAARKQPQRRPSPGASRTAQPSTGRRQQAPRQPAAPARGGRPVGPAAAESRPMADRRHVASSCSTTSQLHGRPVQRGHRASPASPPSQAGPRRPRAELAGAPGRTAGPRATAAAAPGRGHQSRQACTGPLGRIAPQGARALRGPGRPVPEPLGGASRRRAGGSTCKRLPDVLGRQVAALPARTVAPISRRRPCTALRPAPPPDLSATRGHSCRRRGAESTYVLIVEYLQWPNETPLHFSR